MNWDIPESIDIDIYLCQQAMLPSFWMCRTTSSSFMYACEWAEAVINTIIHTSTTWTNQNYLHCSNHTTISACLGWSVHLRVVHVYAQCVFHDKLDHGWGVAMGATGNLSPFFQKIKASRFYFSMLLGFRDTSCIGWWVALPIVIMLWGFGLGILLLFFIILLGGETLKLM